MSDQGDCQVNGGVETERAQPNGQEEEWLVPASSEAHRCNNLIRSCVEIYFSDVVAIAEANQSERNFMKLSIGKECWLPARPSSYL